MISFGLNIVTILIVAGIFVWGRVLVFYIYREKYLSLPAIPEYESTTIRLEHILIVLFTFFFAGGLLQQGMVYLNHPFATEASVNSLASSLIIDFFDKIILIAAMAYILRETNIFGIFGRNKISHWSKIPLIALLIYFAIFPFINIFLLKIGIYVVRDLLHLTTELQHPAIKFLNSPKLSNSLKFVCIVLAGIVSPIAEEMFFRGMLQNYFLKLFRRPIPAILMTSFAFMLVHIPMYQNLPALFTLGVVLGWSYYRYQRLSAPIFVHAIFNSVTLLLWFTGG